MTILLQALAVKAGWLIMVIALDLVLGVIVALKQKTFEWQKLADVLGDYGPKVVGWLALEAVDLIPPEYKLFGGIGSVLGTGAYALIFASALGSILGHIQAIGILPGAKSAMKRLGLPATTTTDDPCP
jgi:hypothetical protein